MKGNNEFILNEATVIEAIQQYFDSKMMPGEAPKVTSVKAEGSGYQTSFKVSLTDREIIE